MIFQESVVVQNAALDAREVAIGNAPQLWLYNDGGAGMPANSAAAAIGTKVASGTLPSDWMAAAASGVKSKLGTWNITGLPAAGAGINATYFRLMDAAGAVCHQQGDISLSVSGAWAPTTAYTAGTRVSNGGKVYQCATGGTSAGSGGPTGTGSGITDGSAVWNYISVLGTMQLDNISVANGQGVTVNSYDWTAGNS